MEHKHAVLDLLKKRGAKGVTGFDGFRLARPCAQIADAIRKLRRDGYSIESVPEQTPDRKSRYSRYILRASRRVKP